MKARALAEWIGTFSMMFLGCGSVMVAERFPGSVPQGGPAVVFGLSVSVMIYALGHISGAHFNPAVTAAFALARHFPPRQLPLYWLAQSSGALMAVSALHLILPAGEGYGQTVSSLPWAQTLAWESILTFFLMFVIIAVATDTRAVGTMAGLAIGATVAIAALVGGPVTGASMNPARSLAPALFAGDLSQIWLYVAGPLIGASLAALAYEALRSESRLKPSIEKGAP